jgi:hypothetical protein
MPLEIHANTTDGDERTIIVYAKEEARAAYSRTTGVAQMRIGHLSLGGIDIGKNTWEEVEVLTPTLASRP